MTEEVKAHETSTSMVKAAPAELDTGTDMALKVKVSCSSACDLRGKIVKIIAQGAVVKEMEVELTEFDGEATETDEFVVKAPTKAGEYTWTAVFPAQEKEGVFHQESSTPFSFIAKLHATWMSVWDVPSPALVSTKFKVKVGVKCSANCKLTDKEIEVYDQEGGKVATGTLGDVPWTTTTLYWAEVELKAPGTEGSYTWEAKFPKPDLKLPHEEASFPFTFGTVRPPDHIATVEVVDKDRMIPLKNASIFVNPRRASTDEHGIAKIGVTKGRHELCVSKHDYAEFQTTIEVAGDVTVKAELLYWPDDYGGV